MRPNKGPVFFCWVLPAMPTGSVIHCVGGLEAVSPVRPSIQLPPQKPVQLTTIRDIWSISCSLDAIRPFLVLQSSSL